jgi:hypothetical protein
MWPKGVMVTIRGGSELLLFIGLGNTLASYIFLAYTHRDLSPKAIYEHITERRSKNSKLAGFEVSEIPANMKRS